MVNLKRYVELSMLLTLFLSFAFHSITGSDNTRHYAGIAAGSMAGVYVLAAIISEMSNS